MRNRLLELLCFGLLLLLLLLPLHGWLMAIHTLLLRFPHSQASTLSGGGGGGRGAPPVHCEGYRVEEEGEGGGEPLKGSWHSVSRLAGARGGGKGGGGGREEGGGGRRISRREVEKLKVKRVPNERRGGGERKRERKDKLSGRNWREIERSMHSFFPFCCVHCGSGRRGASSDRPRGWSYTCPAALLTTEAT